jgi:hypothetical protein
VYIHDERQSPLPVGNPLERVLDIIGRYEGHVATQDAVVRFNAEKDMFLHYCQQAKKVLEEFSTGVMEAHRVVQETDAPCSTKGDSRCT